MGSLSWTTIEKLRATEPRAAVYFASRNPRLCEDSSRTLLAMPAAKVRAPKVNPLASHDLTRHDPRHFSNVKPHTEATYIGDRSGMTPARAAKLRRTAMLACGCRLCALALNPPLTFADAADLGSPGFHISDRSMFEPDSVCTCGETHDCRSEGCDPNCARCG